MVYHVIIGRYFCNSFSGIENQILNTKDFSVSEEFLNYKGKITNPPTPADGLNVEGLTEEPVGFVACIWAFCCMEANY